MNTVECCCVNYSVIVNKAEHSETLVPRPHSKNQERGLVSLVNFPICAESAHALHDHVVATYLLLTRVDEATESNPARQE